MSVSFDDSELRSLSRHLHRNMATVRPAVNGLLTRHANQIAADARANAPKARPWLATEGIQVTTKRPMTRTIYVGRDPRGESTGYRVEFGTSTQPARPFLVPAFRKGRDLFNRDALALLVKATLP